MFWDGLYGFPVDTQPRGFGRILTRVAQVLSNRDKDKCQARENADVPPYPKGYPQLLA